MLPIMFKKALIVQNKKIEELTKRVETLENKKSSSVSKSSFGKKTIKKSGD